MKFIEFRKNIEEIPLFQTKEIRLILGDKFTKSFLNNLKNWQKQDYLIKVRKGFYYPDDLKTATNPITLASKIYYPSYVSLESALGYYGIIPEAVFSITSVTTRKTKYFTNEYFGKFIYKKIKKEAFGGFVTQQEKNVSFNLAVPEKALVDFFYLNRNILDGTREQFEGYRFNEDFRYDKEKLLGFAKCFKNKKVLRLTENFIQYYAS